MSPTTTVLRTALLSALLAGCSASSDSTGTDQGPPESAGSGTDGSVGTGVGQDSDGSAGGVISRGDIAGASLHGQLSIREFADENDRVISVVAARFVALDQAGSRYSDALLRTMDTCVMLPQPFLSVPGSEPDPIDGLLLIPDELILADVPAGENIVLSSPDGTWATLQATQFDNAPVYLDSTSRGRIEGRVPSGLTVDVLADGAFPAFMSVAMPDPQPTANGFVPSIASRVDVTTEYRWPANQASGSRVHLTIDAGDRRIDCFAIDDGLFTAPADMAESIGTNAVLAAVSRESTRVEQHDGATLVLTVATGSP